MPAPITKPGTPIPPAWRVGRLDGIEAFKPGVWNGEEYDHAFVESLHSNFQRFSSGESAHYRPYLTLNHQDHFRFGTVDRADLDGEKLILSAADVPEAIGAWRNAGAVTEPSIEFFLPVRDESGTLVDGFRGPDGEIVDGPVLKCLTLLGPDAPAVKGLSQLPVATFACAGGRVKRVRMSDSVSPTATGGTVDRASVLSALQALGMDTTLITDVVPDEVLQAFLTTLQSIQAGGAAGTPPAGAPMADLTTPALPAPALAAPAVADNSVSIPGVATGGAQPSQVVLKFADNASAKAAGAFLGNMQAQFNKMVADFGAVGSALSAQANQVKVAKVQAFADRLATPDSTGRVRLTPAQKPPMIALLMKCDGAAVRKFADGKGQGTELDEMMKSIESTLPVVKHMGEKFPDHAPGTPGGQGAGLDPSNRRLILSGSMAGRALLAREDAAKK